jgi:hypothetical protein
MRSLGCEPWVSYDGRVRMKAAIILVVLVALGAAGLLFSCRPGAESAVASNEELLDYDQLIQLDAEDLAEEGIARAYRQLEAELRARGVEPAALEEVVSEDGASYQVRCRGVTYPVYAEPIAEQSWGLATYAFFAIVNEQLPKTGPQLYAVNGGNDLGALFLTEEEVAQARAALPRRSDWPYLPTKEAPTFGQPE